MSAPRPSNLREALADLYLALVELAAVLAPLLLMAGAFAVWAGVCALFLGWHAVWFAPLGAGLLYALFAGTDALVGSGPGAFDKITPPSDGPGSDRSA